MILKYYEINKINFNKYKIILFYGENQGHKIDQINNIIRLNNNKKILKFYEKEILEKELNFFENILSQSLFEKEKIIIINGVSEKIFLIINEIIKRNISEIIIILNATILDKKSKLRSLFEKGENLICVPFYPDNNESLSKIIYDFFKQNKISISQSNINLIVNKCGGDRGNLKTELEKIEIFAQNKKILTTENILKLINLASDHSISELVDHCLAKNSEKTANILNENIFGTEDCINLIRTILNKSKRLLKLTIEQKKNKNLDQTISNAKPPIFWKDKDLVKKQINNWTPEKIKELIFNINDIETQIKKNTQNSVNIVLDFTLKITRSNN